MRELLGSSPMIICLVLLLKSLMDTYRDSRRIIVLFMCVLMFHLHAIASSFSTAQRFLRAFYFLQILYILMLISNLLNYLLQFWT